MMTYYHIIHSDYHTKKKQDIYKSYDRFLRIDFCYENFSFLHIWTLKEKADSTKKVIDCLKNIEMSISSHKPPLYYRNLSQIHWLSKKWLLWLIGWYTNILQWFLKWNETIDKAWYEALSKSDNLFLQALDLLHTRDIVR